MSAFPPAVPYLPERVDARAVLASLQAQKSHLALALGRDAEEAQQRPPVEHLLDALCIPGSVVELSSLPGGGGHTLALRVLAEMRARARAEGRPAWLGAIDPSRTLHAPAVAALGIELGSLLVMQPPSERLLRVATRAQRSGVLCATLVDATGEDDLAPHHMVVGVRRLALAAESTGGVVVLLTSPRARRGLPLPVSARALVEPVLSQRGGQELEV